MVSLRKLWLVFAQSATVMLAIVFVVGTLRPEWLPLGGGTQVVELKQAVLPGAEARKIGRAHV